MLNQRLSIVCIVPVALMACLTASGHQSDAVLGECGTVCGSSQGTGSGTLLTSSPYVVSDPTCESNQLICSKARTNWRAAAGLPIREWTAAMVPAGTFSRVQASGRITFGCEPVPARGGVDCGSINITVGETNSSLQSSVGLDPNSPSSCIGYFDFDVPMQSVWVELDKPTGNAACGIRFVRQAPDGHLETIASATGSATCAGVTVNIDAIPAPETRDRPANPESEAGRSAIFSAGIKRVVFDLGAIGDGLHPRVHAIAWRTMEAAVELRVHPRPLVADIVGDLDQSTWQAGQQDRGQLVVQSMWPNSGVTFRQNEARMIAGARQSGADRVIATLWLPTVLEYEWQSVQLEGGNSGPRSVASAISEPLLIGDTRYVFVGGGIEEQYLPSGGGSSNDSRMKPAIWRVRIPNNHGTVSPTDIQRLTVAPLVHCSTGVPCQLNAADDGFVSDLRVLADGTVLGCGRMGVRCEQRATNVAALLQPNLRSVAVAFVAPPSTLTAYPRLIDQGTASENHSGHCIAMTTFGVNDARGNFLAIASSTAQSWVRGNATNTFRQFACVGDTRTVPACCNEGLPAMWCSWDNSSIRWDWNGIPTDNYAQAIVGYARRIAPWATQTGQEPVRFADYSASSAWRSDLAAPDLATPHAFMVSTAGWYSRSCSYENGQNGVPCVCIRQAALVEYRDEVATEATSTLECWSLNGPELQLRTNGLRLLDLNECLWVTGNNELLPPDAESAASDVTALTLAGQGDSAQIRLVTGFRAAGPNGNRAVAWTGERTTAPLEGSTGRELPDANWCGMDVQDLVLKVRSVAPDHTTAVLTNWQDLDITQFSLVLSSCQSATSDGRLLTIGQVTKDRGAQLLSVHTYFAQDLNNDGVLTNADLGLLLGAWGPCNSSCQADFNGDEVVNGTDLGLFFGATHPSFSLACSLVAEHARDIARLQLAASLLGYDSLGEIGGFMAALPLSQASVLADVLVAVADSQQ